MSLFDLSGVISDLATPGTFAVSRRAPGALTNGRFFPANPTTINIVASIQPLSGRDLERGRALERLPEGLRTRELLKVYSATQLFVQGAGQDPDVLTISGTQYQVQTAEQWGPDGNYWKMIVAKIGRQSP